MTVHMSYLGSCHVVPSSGTPFQIYCTDLSGTRESAPQYYDHTIGLRESLTIDNRSIQKKIYRYSPRLPKVSLSGVMTLETLRLIDYARYGMNRTTGSDVTGMTVNANYFWNRSELLFGVFPGAQMLRNAVVESFTFTMQAGDVTTCNINFIGTRIESVTSVAVAGSCVKPLTWDACRVKCVAQQSQQAGLAILLTIDEIASFSLTVRNPVLPIYTSKTAATSSGSGYELGETGLDPKELRLGMQEVTGSITTYRHIDFNNQEDLITFALGDSGSSDKWTLRVAYEAPTNRADGGPYLSTVNFHGVSDQSGGVWRNTHQF